MLDDARWSVSEAKAKLSEILRRARSGAPQMIGSDEPCFVVSAGQFEQMWQSRHLGKFLIESAPKDCELETPSRADRDGELFDIEGAG